MKTKISYLLLCTCVVSTGGAFAAGAEIDDDNGCGLIGRWTFDDLTDGMLKDSVRTALDATVQGNVSLQDGVFAAAACLDGQQAIRIKASEVFRNLPSITISAWVSPSELSGYREIFRKEDGDRRILFSFQNGGRILSLGLNVAGSGYEELDARVRPALLTDLQWHHVAGTFDGRTMRVYLDGLEIDSKRKPGSIVSGGGADAFIGSHSGRSEFFQGLMDDLRIFNVALTGAQIATLYEEGQAAIGEKVEGYREQAKDMYEERVTFAETMAATRRNLKGKDMPRALTRLIQAKLAARFSGECADFSEATDSQLFEYLTAADNSWNLSKAEHLIDLLSEYKPLTRQQWARVSETQREKWKDLEQLTVRLERLKNMGEAGTCEADWIELMLEAAARVVYRPVQYEAVAPYVKPYTPPTRDYSAKEAQKILRRDWLHQADGAVTAQRIKSEIRWTREVAARIKRNFPERMDFSKELSELRALEAAMGDSSDEQLYYTVRSIKRRIMFADPAVDFDSVLFIDIPFPAGSEWPHETRHRLGYMAVPGGRLLTLKGLSPAGHLTKLMPVEPLHGTFWRPDLSFDAKRVLFSFHPANEKNFHIYEINIDGSGLRQITDGIYDDVDPIYLPDDERIVFASTRGHNYVRCMPPTNSFVLTRCGLDGRNIYIISRNNEPDYLPSLLNDGRVIYTRWEYTDKPLWRAQSLWTMNPDGTRAATFWGNQSVWPDLLKDARPIPNSERVMFTGSAHHDWFAGSIGIVDARKGLNFPGGLTKVTAELIWPESGNGPVDPIESQDYHKSGDYRAYQTPYPLSEDVFLVSANRAGKFVLYLMDTAGNKELIYEGVHNIFHAMPLKPRPKPAAIPDSVRWPSIAERSDPADGIIFSNNVYHNAPAELKGKASYLRILTMDAKTYSYWYKRPYASTGPVVSMVSSEGVKRILGTVPIESDGSVHFRAPSGKSLYFQLLDDKYRALQTMRSVSGVMPGETRGCLGCHEMHSTTPATQTNAEALQRGPSEITPPPWGDESISYMRFVQPVLDKY
ncbi:MAG: LamG-like jellyroll fold domain-containing protein, partial [Planctomycetota bacterium]